MILAPSLLATARPLSVSEAAHLQNVYAKQDVQKTAPISGCKGALGREETQHDTECFSSCFPWNLPDTVTLSHRQVEELQKQIAEEEEKYSDPKNRIMRSCFPQFLQ